MLKYPILYEMDCGKCKWKYIRVFENENMCYKCKVKCDLVNVHDSLISNSTIMPFSIVIKTTFGDFKKNYNDNCLLHVGISNSIGEVYNFDGKGVKRERIWNECVGIRLNYDKLCDDQLMLKHYNDEIMREKRIKYHGIRNNCFSFAIRFLNMIKKDGEKRMDKFGFANQYIQKVTNNLSIYLGLLKHRSVIFCDGCRKRDLREEDRYKCCECDDFDLCKDCVDKGITTGDHNDDHIMMKI